MSWISQQYEGEFHVVPDHDTALTHVLSTDCECVPERDPEDLIWVHNDRLDREVAPVLLQEDSDA